MQGRDRAERAAHDADRTRIYGNAAEEDIVFAPSSERVLYHRLGRQPQMWRVNDLTSPTGAAVSAPPSRVAWDAETITIRNNASVAVTMRLEVG